jgi:hypothetical protein
MKTCRGSGRAGFVAFVRNGYRVEQELNVLPHHSPKVGRGIWDWPRQRNHSSIRGLCKDLYRTMSFGIPVPADCMPETLMTFRCLIVSFGPIQAGR